MLSADKTAVYTDFSGLAKLKAQARQESPAALQKVARQFESIFLNMVLKSMREAKLADGIMDSDQSRFFQDMYDKQLAVHLAGDGGIGLAGLIVRQLSPDKPSAGVRNQGLDAYRSQPVMSGSVSRPLRQPGSEQISPQVKTAADRPITSAEQFVRQLSAEARQAGEQLGVDGRMLLAQAALESGWGAAVIGGKDGRSSYNLFNIKADKAWQGRRMKVASLEYEQGRAVKKQSAFRAYGSYRESFQDYVRFIRDNPRYQQALRHAGSARRYIQDLQQAGYATDPRYAEKVIKVFHSSAMAQYRPDQQLAMRGTGR